MTVTTTEKIVADILLVSSFYRAMHFSAKRVCLSVRLSVCNVGGLWSHRLEYIRNNLPLVSLGCSLSADPNIIGLLQGEHPQIWAQSDPPPCWFERRRHSIANCGRMVTDSSMVTMESLRETTIALSNGALADPLRPPLPPKWGFHVPPRYANGHISATGDPIHFMFGSI